MFRGGRWEVPVVVVASGRCVSLWIRVARAQKAGVVSCSTELVLSRKQHQLGGARRGPRSLQGQC